MHIMPTSQKKQASLTCLVLSYILQTPRQDIAQKGVRRLVTGWGLFDRVDWSDAAWSRDSGKVTASSGKLMSGKVLEPVQNTK